MTERCRVFPTVPVKVASAIETNRKQIPPRLTQPSAAAQPCASKLAQLSFPSKVHQMKLPFTAAPRIRSTLSGDHSLPLRQAARGSPAGPHRVRGWNPRLMTPLATSGRNAGCGLAGVHSICRPQLRSSGGLLPDTHHDSADFNARHFPGESVRHAGLTW